MRLTPNTALIGLYRFVRRGALCNGKQLLCLLIGNAQSRRTIRINLDQAAFRHNAALFRTNSSAQRRFFSKNFVRDTKKALLGDSSVAFAYRSLRVALPLISQLHRKCSNVCTSPTSLTVLLILRKIDLKRRTERLY